MGTTAGVGTMTPDAVTAVDPLALPIAAARLDAAADMLNAARRIHLAGLRSRGPIDELIAAVARWESAVREVATALRAAADRYIESETRAAEALR